VVFLFFLSSLFYLFYFFSSGSRSLSPSCNVNIPLMFSASARHQSSEAFLPLSALFYSVSNTILCFFNFFTMFSLGNTTVFLLFISTIFHFSTFIFRFFFFFLFDQKLKKRKCYGEQRAEGKKIK
jgi:hypothetical protein